MMMDSVLTACVVSLWMINSITCNIIDCTFESGSEANRCGYQKGWDGSLRANWKLTNRSRDRKLDSGTGHFLYFEAKTRPLHFSSRIISPKTDFYDDVCISFSYVNKGIKAPYPDGRSKLEVYFSPGGRTIRKDDKPIWSSVQRTSRDKWKTVKARVSHYSLGERLHGSIVFAAVRGRSKRSYIAIDNIAVKDCGDHVASSVSDMKPDFDVKDPSSESALGFFRTLAAHRPVHTRKFSIPPGGVYDPSNPVSLPTFSNRLSQRGGRRHRERRKKAKNNRKSKVPRVFYVPEENVPIDTGEPFVPILVGQERPPAVCNFMKYTQGLQKCLRAFFSLLRQHRSRKKCNSDYQTLENCLKTVAADCVPSDDMTEDAVHEVVSDMLKNKFKTKQVYCLEEGAFVFPDFVLGSLPLQCSRQYLGQLTACGGSFANIFNFRHGDQSLCREYFQANECQRRATADECTFDTKSMLIYGLNLQYQFAHNPFCIDLPFSAWWPNE